MTDDERTAFRWNLIRGTYWLIGIDTVLSVAMYLQAEKTSVKWITGLAIPVPLISSLFSWARFERGPWRKEKIGAGIAIEPVVLIAGASTSSGLQIFYSF
jgi:hypothetical protein